jgi:ubiquinone biosynthesis protein
MPPNYTMVFKALMTIEGIGKTLAPEMNFISEAQPVVKEMLVERYSPRRIAKESVDVLGALSRFLRVFPQAATQLLQDAQKGSLAFRVQSDDAAAVAMEMREASQRQA